MHDDDEDLFVMATGTTSKIVNIDQSLSRPFLNNPQDPKSLLFRSSDDEQPSRNEKDENNVVDTVALRLWRTCKNQLPFVVTGARTASRTADENPIGGIYNIVFVRLPTIVAGFIYAKNLLLDGHGMIVDLGFGGAGPFELPPIIVGAALYVILR